MPRTPEDIRKEKTQGILPSLPEDIHPEEQPLAAFLARLRQLAELVRGVTPEPPMKKKKKKRP
jgi:hypothetical protein